MPEIVERCCSKCGEMKHPDRIVRNRNICKDCCNLKKKENAKNKVVDLSIQKTCTQCDAIKIAALFIQRRNICKDCNNLMRRTEYQENEELRLKRRKQGRIRKKKKKLIRDELKASNIKKLEEEIGKDNTICKYCKEVKAKTHFRHNRLKCKDCERDDPFEKFKRYVRTRIYK
jgi:hypothetical protein